MFLALVNFLSINLFNDLPFCTMRFVTSHYKHKHCANELICSGLLPLECATRIMHVDGFMLIN